MPLNFPQHLRGFHFDGVELTERTRTIFQILVSINFGESFNFAHTLYE